MSNQPISALRARMIEDMTIRGFTADTQRDYIRSVKSLASFIGRSPDTATQDDIRRFQFALRKEGATPSKINSIVSGLRFFFNVTLGRPEIERWTQFVREPRRLPVILSPDEVARLIECAPGPGLKYKAALSVAYGAGLRASEVVSLQVGDIDSRRMLIRVDQGKGGKDRYVMLSPSLLELLRDWWRQSRTQAWLFPGRGLVQHITTRQLNRAFHAAADMAGIDKKVSLHTLRHSFATHLLEQNIDVRVIQVLLGHAKLDTTALYTRVATSTIGQVISPLDRLRQETSFSG
jgi:integrase/recombinase XerD